MLKVDTIHQIRNLLLSDRIAYKGNEVTALSRILAELAVVENEITRLARVKPATTPEKTDEHD
jgi:hypothetical protein